MSLIGQEYKQPRVLAHDVFAVTVFGQINNTAPDNGLNVTSGGSDYEVGDKITVTRPTGHGHAAADSAVVIVDAINDDGGVTRYHIEDPVASVTENQLYLVGNPANQIATDSTAGSGFQAVVTNTNLPNTNEAGVCLYVGGAGDIEVTLESGNSAIFAGVNGGSFLPILVKGFVISASLTNTDATDILALY
jgi:hypothetical protein